MNKPTTAFIFSIMFAMLTLAPNVIMLVDKNCDISILIDSNEEEKQGEEKGKDFEKELFSKEYVQVKFFDNKPFVETESHIINYSSLFNELTSPPPEII